jgi:hypothetical protein
MEIQLIRLVSGEELVGEITKTKNGIVIKNACIIVPTNDGKLTAMHYMPYSDAIDGITIAREHIMFTLEPASELKNYIASISSAIELPEEKRIIQ